MSINFNIMVAVVFLMGISFTHVALEGLELKVKEIDCIPLNTGVETSKHEKKEGADYSLPSIFLFDKNS